MKDKLLILDMDNTILHSKIDFHLMLNDVALILKEKGFGKCVKASIAKTMLAFTQAPDYDEKLSEILWERIAQIEAVGLDQAQLEPDTTEALAYLSEFAELAILSNNTDEAIENNLQRLGLVPYLSFWAGRDSVPFLKPSPAGMLFVREHYSEIGQEKIFSIGDAHIDALAAQAANIGFIAYNRSREEKWDEWNIKPILQLRQWDKASCESIRRLWE